MWGNSVMERAIGGCRHELLDRILVWNPRHLMIALREYEDFCNRHRPHRILNQAAPLSPLPDGVTDLDQFRIQRRDRAGGVIHCNAWLHRFSAPTGWNSPRHQVGTGADGGRRCMGQTAGSQNTLRRVAKTDEGFAGDQGRARACNLHCGASSVLLMGGTGA